MAGALLLAATYLPTHRLLDPDTTGRAGAGTRAVAEPLWQLAWLGTALVLAVAALLVWRADTRQIRDAWQIACHRISDIPASVFAWCVGGLAAVLAGGIGAVVFRHEPTLVDGMVQLLHARVLRAGHLSATLPDPLAAWSVQNGWITGHEWSSIYPPGHAVLLALGMAVGAPWLVGPLMTGVTVAFTALSVERLWPEDPGRARIAVLFVALSPFVLFLGAGYLSHVSAAAFAALTLWAALRARDGSARWAVVLGAAVGAFVCTRPWTGLVTATAVIGTTWGSAFRRRGARWLTARVGWTLLGGAPFAAALLTWNARLFGNPLRLGYTVAFGPAHGLGLHPDPWGNAYGLLEATAYTGADLLQLGLRLLETPLPATLPLAILLLWGRRLPTGSTPLVAWALAPLLANALYWHHGIHMGPRMLYEAAPAWILLAVLAAVELARRGSGAPQWLHEGVVWSVLVSLGAAPFLIVGAARAYAPSAATRAVATVPAPPAGRPALVLIHGSWASRVAARLAASGMRRDSVETALRRNDLCSVELYAAWREAGAGGVAPPLDLVARPGTPAALRWAEISPGNRVRVRPGAPPEPSCRLQARADRFGTVELEPLLWQVGPPQAQRPLVLARDLGPALNRRTLAAFPGRNIWVYMDAGAGAERGAAPILLPYAQGMRRLWGLSAPPAPPEPARRRSDSPGAR